MMKFKLMVILMVAVFSIAACTSSNKTNDADSTMMMDDGTMHDTSDMKMGADTTKNDSMMVDTMNR
jgi:uncharacterized lipoprotein